MDDSTEGAWIDGELSDAELHYAAAADTIHEMSLITHRAMAQKLIRLRSTLIKLRSTQPSDTAITLSEEELAALKLFRSAFPDGPDAVLARLIDRLLSVP